MIEFFTPEQFLPSYVDAYCPKCDTKLTVDTIECDFVRDPDDIKIDFNLYSHCEKCGFYGHGLVIVLIDAIAIAGIDAMTNIELQTDDFIAQLGDSQNDHAN